jgi:hypothetical protein
VDQRAGERAEQSLSRRSRADPVVEHGYRDAARVREERRHDVATHADDLDRSVVRELLGEREHGTHRSAHRRVGEHDAHRTLGGRHRAGPAWGEPAHERQRRPMRGDGRRAKQATAARHDRRLGGVHVAGP